MRPILPYFKTSNQRLNGLRNALKNEPTQRIRLLLSKAAIFDGKILFAPQQKQLVQYPMNQPSSANLYLAKES